MMQVIEMSDKEKLKFYRKHCSFTKLAKMLIELQKHIPPNNNSFYTPSKPKETK